MYGALSTESFCLVTADFCALTHKNSWIGVLSSCFCLNIMLTLTARAARSIKVTPLFPLFLSLVMWQITLSFDCVYGSVDGQYFRDTVGSFVISAH